VAGRPAVERRDRYEVPFGVEQRGRRVGIGRDACRRRSDEGLNALGGLYRQCQAQDAQDDAQ
jgi:hypothetical protein